MQREVGSVEINLAAFPPYSFHLEELPSHPLSLCFVKSWKFFSYLRPLII